MTRRASDRARDISLLIAILGLIGTICWSILQTGSWAGRVDEKLDSINKRLERVEAQVLTLNESLGNTSNLISFEDMASHIDKELDKRDKLWTAQLQALKVQK